VNTASSETTPKLSADGLTLYFSSDRAGGSGGNDVYRATRWAVTEAFTTPMRVVELCSDSSDAAAFEVDGGTVLYMSSTRFGGVGGLDIYRSFRGSPVLPWSAPALLLEIDTAGVEADPWVDAADTIMYFDSDRAGGTGGRDIWLGARSTFSGPFGSFAALSELNSTYDDMDPWLSPDQRAIFFSTTRLGDEDIFYSVR
jgi:hypothetical protein